MPLALVIFDESTAAAIECNFPEKSDAACVLPAFQKLFVICNAKTQYNTSNMLGNAVICNDSKLEFLLSFATWIEQWSTCPNFLLTKQTSYALITTLKVTSCLLSELLNEGYKYVLTVRFQSHPLEQQFSKYRQMGGGRFLVSLREVTNSLKKLKISSFVKESINFWEEDVFIIIDLKETVLKIEKEVSPIMTKIFETELSEDSKQVAVYIAGYVAKKIKKHLKCQVCNKKIISNDNDVENG